MCELQMQVDIEMTVPVESSVTSEPDLATLQGAAQPCSSLSLPFNFLVRHNWFS